MKFGQIISYLELDIADSAVTTPARSDAAQLVAFDLRGGVTVGKTFAERWVPYASVRAFAGPVMWHRAGEDVTGGDRYHVTAGAGRSSGCRPASTSPPRACHSASAALRSA